MDALIAAACKNLTNEALPKLLKILTELQHSSIKNPTIDQSIKAQILECMELLRILSDEPLHSPAFNSSQNSEHTAIETDTGELTDEQAEWLLSQMDDDGKQGEASNDNDEISDDEAARLLAEMENPSNEPDNGQSEEDEALALLQKIESEQVNIDAPIVIDDANEESIIQEHVEEIAEFANNEFATDPEMLNDFVSNADELMQSLDEQILALEADPTNKSIIEEIFRAAHTLKGAAGMFGFKAIERVMHRMENFFDQVRKEKLTAQSESIDVILRALDVLKSLLQGVKNGKESGTKTAPIIQDLNAICSGLVRPKPSAVARKSGTNETEGDLEPKKNDGQSKPTKKDTSTIRVDLQRLDALVNLVGELVIDRTRFSNIEEELRTKAPEIKLANNMTETVQLFGRHMNEIQDIIMKVRMVPIGNAFNKFSRIVRDLSRQLNKEIELFIDGETTELDKTLVEQIGDPLVHLIRNACDHGIETPEKRIGSGKTSRGTILLAAKQEGNQIILTIKDDGKGIDPTIIRRKAIEKGIISEDDNLSNHDIFALIFEAGFSTASEVTNISGRGVGMDVVKRQISKLKGTIDIESQIGQGTTITINLPLTLAILHSLLVQTGRDTFAIPLSSVVESLRIHPSEIQKVGDTEVIKRRDRVLPLLYLKDAMELWKRDQDFWYDRSNNIDQKTNQSIGNTKKERLFVVVVGSAGRRFGIVVDSLLNQQEMVIKSLGRILSDLPCIAGGSILGNGEVVLVLDIAELDDNFRTKLRQVAA